jgi:hypothetical protein
MPRANYANKVKKEFDGSVKEIRKMYSGVIADKYPTTSWEGVKLYMEVYDPYIYPSPIITVDQWVRGDNEFRVGIGWSYEERGIDWDIDEISLTANEAVKALKKAPSIFIKD